MTIPSRIEQWLGDYSQWRNNPPPDLWVNSGSTPTAEVINGETVSCRPDGGMANFVQQHNRMLRMERAARAVQDALPFLPDQLKPVFDATYVGPHLEVPRRERDAAARMGISRNQYQKLKFGLHMWFMGMNFQAVAVQFDRDVSTIKTVGRKKT